MVLSYAKGSPNVLFFRYFQLLKYSLGCVKTNLKVTKDHPLVIITEDNANPRHASNSLFMYMGRKDGHMK